MAGLFLQKQYLTALSYYKVSQNVDLLLSTSMSIVVPTDGKPGVCGSPCIGVDLILARCTPVLGIQLYSG